MAKEPDSVVLKSPARRGRLSKLEREAAKRIAAERQSIDEEYVLSQLRTIIETAMDTDTYDPVSAIRALTQLGKYLGMEQKTDQQAGNVTNVFAGMSTQDLQNLAYNASQGRTPQLTSKASEGEHSDAQSTSTGD